MEGTISRRVIPSDNSCLFNVVGYVMDHDKQKAPELRQVIAATVASDPTKYSEAFLGKPNQEYCAWILNPEKWGEKLGKKLSNGVYCNVATRSSSSNEELTVLAMVGERFGLQQLDLIPVGVSGH